MTSTQPTHIHPLSSLRGIAALWVYLYHCQFLTTQSAYLNEITKRGYFGVDIFFVLSGFIIAYTHLDDFPTWQAVRANTKRFLLLRLARIYPLYVATIIGIILLQQSGVFQPSDKDNFSSLLQNLLMIQAWGGLEYAAWNRASWSISVEWLLYLLFPLIAVLVAAKARRDMVTNLLLIALSLAVWMWYFSAARIDVSYMHEPVLCLPRGILDFTIGIALCNLYRLRFLDKLPWDFITVAIIAGFFGVIYFKMLRLTHDIAFILLSAALVYAMANLRGRIGAFFSLRPLVYLGEISYSLYMWHLLYIILVWMQRDTFFAERSFFTWQFVVMTAALIALSALSYHLIEVPARKWLRRRIG